MIYEYKNTRPTIADSAFIAPSSDIIGDVVIGENSSVWFQVVIRGDVNYIRIGENCNIQDLSLIHVTSNRFPTVIGNSVSLGHRATVHGATLKNHSFIGMCATVLDGAEIGEFSLVGAGSLVPPGKKIPPGVLVLGSPAKIIREITEEDRAMIERTAKLYSDHKNTYKNSELFRI